MSRINKTMARMLARYFERKLAFSDLLAAKADWSELRDLVAMQCDALDTFELDMLTDWVAAEFARKSR